MADKKAPPIASEFVFTRRVLIVAGIAILLAALWALSDVLLLLFGSVLFAMTLWSVASPIARMGLSETPALIVAGLLILGVIVTAGWFFGTQIADQLEGLSNRLTFVLRDALQELQGSAVAEMLRGANPGFASFIPRFVSWGVTIGGAVLGVLLVIVGGLYLAADLRSYREGVIKLVPPAYQPNVSATLNDAGHALQRWLRGQLIAMVLVGTLTGLGLWLAGVQSALALGLLAGLLNFIPYIGSISAALVTLVIAGGQGWEPMLWAAGVMIAVQQIESNFITPFVVGRVVSLQPAVGLFAIVAMGILFGPLGLLFGFPLAIVTDVAVRRLYVRDTLQEPVEILGRPAAPSAMAAGNPGGDATLSHAK